MYSSPEAIRRLADAMRKQADQIDGQAARLVGDSDRLVWEGLAATAMRAHVRWQANELRQAAIRHREAATDLDHHAARIAYLLDMIAQIEHTVVQAVAAAKARVLRVLDGLLDSVTPLDDLLTRFVLLPPGDRRWLEVRLPGLPLPVVLW